MSNEIERFYALLSRLAERPSQGERLANLRAMKGLPARGVYFFFESGEHRAAELTSERVVRVGTHAVSSGSKSTLRSRLRAHRGSEAGTGNHRSSIFRLHVGNAMLDRDREQLDSWGVRSSAPALIRSNEEALERRVSAFIANMRFLWVAVPDDPGPKSVRAYLERNSIAILSNSRMPIDSPSPTWLGHYSPVQAIRKSGLWNLKHVDDRVDPYFLDVLEKHTG